MSIPERIGNYQVQEIINTGIFSVLYRASDPTSGRALAIKSLALGEVHNRTAYVRFQRDLEIAERLSHPAIVPLEKKDIGDGNLYLVMPFLTGGSLRERLAVGRIDPADIVRILARLAAALDAAHTSGLVHRDLKPENILFDSSGEAYLTDFAMTSFAEACAVSPIGAIFGPPAYLSPEQAQGMMVRGGSSDIYSLGILAYQMLTGRLPYSSDTALGYAVQHCVAPLPDYRQLNPEIPDSLMAIIAKAAAKNPAERFVKVADFADQFKANSAGLAATGASTLQIHPLASATTSSLAGNSFTQLTTAPADSLNPPTTTVETGQPLQPNTTVPEGQPATTAVAGELTLPKLKPRRSHLWIWILSGVLILALSVIGMAYFRVIPGLPLPGQLDRLIAEIIPVKEERLPTELETPGLPSDVAGSPGKENGQQAIQTISPPASSVAMAITPTPTLPLPSPSEPIAASESIVYPTSDPIQPKTEKFQGTDDLFSIAGRYQIDLNHLLGANNLGCWDPPSPSKTILYLPSPGIEQMPGPYAMLREEYLDQRSLVRILECMDHVNDLAFSPDGKILAVARDNSIYLWRVADWRPLKERFRGHLSTVTSIAFSPDGSELVSGSEDRTVRIWSVDSGKLNIKVNAHQATVTDVTFSPDGKKVVSASLDQTVKIWNKDTMEHPMEFKGYAANCVEFSHDKKYLAICYGDRITLRDTTSFALVKDIHSDSPVSHLAFSTDGLLVSSGSDFWQVQEARHIYSIGPSAAQVAFSPDGKLIFIGESIWRVADGSLYGNLVSPVPPSSESPYDRDRLVINPDGTLIAWANREGLTIWGVLSGKAVAVAPGEQQHTVVEGDTYFNIAAEYGVSLESLLNINRNPPCHTIYTGQKLEIPTVIAAPNVLSSTPIQPSTVERLDRLLTLNNTCVKDRGDISFSPDSQLIASGANLWSIQRDSVLVQEQTPRLNKRDADGIVDPAPLIVFSPTEDIAAVRSQCDIDLWNMIDGRLVQKLYGERVKRNGIEFCNNIAGMAFSSDGKMLASGTGVDPNTEEAIRIWRVEDGEVLHEMKGYAGKNLFFTPDNSRLLVTWESKDIRFYNLSNRKWEEPLLGVEERFNLSPDGNRLAYIGCEEKSGVKCIKDIAVVFNFITGKNENEFHGFSDMIQDVVFDKEGSTIFVASSWAIVQWDLATATKVRTLDPGPQERSSISDLTLTPDGSMLVSHTIDDRLLFWDVNSGTMLKVLDLAYQEMAFSSDMTRMGFLVGDSVSIWGIP